MPSLAELVVLVVVVQSVMAMGKDGRCGVYSDGCSDPFNLTYKAEFTLTCHRHDVCYACGARYGFSRRRCDDTFRSSMRTACRSQTTLSPAQRLACEANTHTYFFGVRLFGAAFYRSAGRVKAYCRQTWVPSCLPPVLSSLPSKRT